MKITVIGTGYVGSVTGACLAYLGHHVTCVDTDQTKIARWRSGEPPIYEPFLRELVAAAAERKNIEFSTELGPAVRASDVIFIAVGTPPLPDGSPNLIYLESASRGIGAAMDDSLYPDRIVLGSSDDRTLRIMVDLYRPLVEQSFAPPPGVPRPGSLVQVPLVTTTLTSAEMIKYAANAFLAMKIGFANEMANICEYVGAEATEVMLGIGLDTRIGSKFLNAGVGWGGSCFGKDVQALLQTAGEYGYCSKLLQATLDVNAAQRHLVIQKLQEKLFILKGRTIGLLGLAFKPDTDDLRDAPALHIAERLIQIGARVKAYDPIAMRACRELHPELRIRYCESPRDVAADADALVLVTEWKEFAELPLEELAAVMAKPVLVDGRNLFRPEAAIAAGFDYTGIGRCPRPVNDRRVPKPERLGATTI